jgi:3-hydroxybutyrate dehydrogenase
VIFNGADMSRPEQIVAMLEEARERFGSVDIIVNNAGIQKVAPIEAFPVDKWDAILAINLSSAFHTMRTAVPWMKVPRWGRIINIGSAHSLIASPFKSAYVVAKHGLLGLTKTVALELAESGITRYC